MSVGAFPPMVLDNATHPIFHGFGTINGGTGIVDGSHATSGSRPSMAKNCIDLHQRLIPHGVNFVPGPDECILCACDDGEPKWCKAVYCAPPQDCKSFRVGASCCQFICMDDSLNNGGPNTGGPYLSRPVEMANFVPKVVIAAVTAMLSLSLLFFLIHRLRKRHIQGRLNSARARRSTQMCDECDDTRSLDFSNDFFEHRMNSPHLYPPQYLAWWKPPSSYFPPRGEAPPPYEEAMMAITSIGGNNSTATTAITMPYGNNNNNLQNSNNHHGIVAANNTSILNDIPIIVPPPVLPPGPQGGAMGGARASPAAIQRLASAIANSTTSGGSTKCGSVAIVTSASASSPQQIAKGNNSSQGEAAGLTCQVFKNRSKSSKSSKSSKVKDRRNPSSSGDGEPQPGPSRLDTETAPGRRYSGESSAAPRSFRASPPDHGPAPPTYEDAIYSLHPTPRSTYYSTHRHSLTLPPKRFIDEARLMAGVVVPSHLYPQVVVHGGSSGVVSGEAAGPLTCYTEEELLRRAQQQSQRYSLQFNVGGGSDSILGNGIGNGGDWSSSSSTLSLSTSPNSPVGGRAQSLSSSSESSVSENPPPPPAPTSSFSNNNTTRA